MNSYDPPTSGPTMYGGALGTAQLGRSTAVLRALSRDRDRRRTLVRTGAYHVT
jgi:hypothetical protein